MCLVSQVLLKLVPHRLNLGYRSYDVNPEGLCQASSYVLNRYEIGTHFERKLLILWHSDSEAARAWPLLDSAITNHLSELDACVKHLNDINSLSKVNLDRQVKDMALRHAAIPEPEEHATFPLTMVQEQQNEQFYGREEELKKLNDALDWRENPALRTYTIYGRRGVGKTQIAVQYAYSNPANFDAIFWIRCETSVSLRQSFTEMAVALQLPGADRHGHHEENLIAVQKWLKLTPRRWLMVFDNAGENHSLAA